jgi:hypothetical protein
LTRNFHQLFLLLTTWAYRVAVNYVLDVKKSSVERLHLSFEQFAEGLTTGLDRQAPPETERSMLIEEVKVGCTLGSGPWKFIAPAIRDHRRWILPGASWRRSIRHAVNNKEKRRIEDFQKSR